MKSRLFFLHFFMWVLSAAIIVRLFLLQVLSFEVYKELAENQHQLYKTLVSVRGEIYVREAKSNREIPAVTNIEKNLVFAVPAEIENKDEAAASLAKILELPHREIRDKISDDNRKWVPLKKELPESKTSAVEQLKLKGVYLEPESFRFYPEKVFASQALGFFAYLENERVGRYGVEEYYQDILAGKPGSLSLEKDVAGRWITGGDRDLEPAVDGADIVLTIDRAIQFQAETVLQNTVEGYLADDGSIVVLEPRTGRILALANYPSFDPNTFNKVDNIDVYRNRAVSDAYEPGSVFKPFTMSAGLDSEAVAPDMTFEDVGYFTLDKFTIRNANNKTYGVQNMSQILEQSINTGAIFVAAKTGGERLFEYIKKFGFGHTTGITLPGESAGDLRNLERGGDIHYATASFGQGITVTPLQLAQAYGAIANGGKMMKPYIVEKINYQNGETQTNSPQESRQVISGKAANTVAAMLVNVVENGHGKRAGVPGYYVGGKTGTAQVARADGPGYDESKTVGTFAGFGPVDNPAFVIVVKITNPKIVRFAESTAAPAFGEMAKFLLNYLQIPPSR